MLDPGVVRAKLLGPPIGTVIGYHATRASVARAILRGGQFRRSRNPYDWLGDGVYFWEAAPERAWQWAHTPRVQERLGPDVAIIAARIRLERCIDLHDVVWHAQIEAVYERLRTRYAGRRPALPRQSARGVHGWDRAVLNALALQLYRASGLFVGVIRASFREPDDRPLFSDSALYRGAHVQIAVRDLALIEEVWLARP